MTALILQAGTGAEYRGMLAATWLHHHQYASQHDFDFWALDGYVGAVGWARFRVLAQAFAAGYEFCAYLDADAVVLDWAVDLRTALPREQHMGAVYYDYRDTGNAQPDHWQVGVFYARNTPHMRAFLADLLTAEPAPYHAWPAWWEDPGSEQRVFNAFVKLDRWARIPYRIDYRWNTISEHEHGIQPVVYHLAGTPRVQRKATLHRLVGSVL